MTAHPGDQLTRSRRITTLVVLGAAVAGVFVDSRGGGFGPPSLTRFRCPDARTYVLAPGRCEFSQL